MRENRVLVLPVNTLTVWRAGFTWPHDTLPCVLIVIPNDGQYDTKSIDTTDTIQFSMSIDTKWVDINTLPHV